MWLTSENALTCDDEFFSKLLSGDERSPSIYLPLKKTKTPMCHDSFSADVSTPNCTVFQRISPDLPPVGVCGYELF